MKISVVMPLYNAERYVGAALESIFAQTLAPIEIVVLDDGSTDDSAAVVQRFLPRLHYLWQPQSGGAAALNAAIQATQGDWIAILDADDLWLPDKLAVQSAAVAADPTLALLFGHVEQFYSPDCKAARQTIPPPEVFVGHIPSAMLVRRTVFDQIGYFDTSWQTGYFLEWFLRTKNLQMKMQTLSTVVTKRRLHDTNLGRRKRDQQVEYIQVLKRNLAWQQSQGIADNGTTVI